MKLSFTSKRKIRNLSAWTRTGRKVHHYLGLFIAVFLLVSAITGLLLGWKKNSEAIQPPTKKGITSSLSEWLSVEQLAVRATENLHNVRSGSYIIDRMDIRPDKGIVKVLFKPGYWEVQVDGSTGEVLSISKRYSDLIEQIHDGSIISDFFKLISMNILGVGIIVLILSGLWLWLGPWCIRRIKQM